MAEPDLKSFQPNLDAMLNPQVFDKQIQELKADEEKGERRIFSKLQKDLCWNKAATVPGRDPERWRYDAVGNPVLYTLRGCKGAICHEYDHIVPFSKGGKTVVSNCQIL